MCRIHIDGLVERESDVALVDSSVQSRRKVGERGLRQTGDQLLDVADTLSGGGGRARTETVPEVEV